MRIFVFMMFALWLSINSYSQEGSFVIIEKEERIQSGFAHASSRYYLNGQYDKLLLMAIDSYEAALRQLGKENHYTLRYLYCAARAHMKLHEYDKAITLYLQCFETWKKLIPKIIRNDRSKYCHQEMLGHILFD